MFNRCAERLQTTHWCKSCAATTTHHIPMLPTTGWLGFPVIVGLRLEHAIQRPEVCPISCKQLSTAIEAVQLRNARGHRLCSRAIRHENQVPWVDHKTNTQLVKSHTRLTPPCQSPWISTGAISLSNWLINPHCHPVEGSGTLYPGVCDNIWDSCHWSNALALERMRWYVTRLFLRANRQAVSNVGELKAIEWPTLV